MSKRASPYIEETPPSFANNSIHAPLHSERGWGRGFFSIREGRFVTIRRASLYIKETPPLFAISSLHAPSYYFAGVKMS